MTNGHEDISELRPIQKKIKICNIIYSPRRCDFRCFYNIIPRSEYQKMYSAKIVEIMMKKSWKWLKINSKVKKTLLELSRRTRKYSPNPQKTFSNHDLRYTLTSGNPFWWKKHRLRPHLPFLCKMKNWTGQTSFKPYGLDCSQPWYRFFGPCTGSPMIRNHKTMPKHSVGIHFSRFGALKRWNCPEST